MSLHVRPISDLRNKSLEISKLVHKTKGSVIITRNGREDMVIMSFEQWEDLVAYPLLMEAEEDEANGGTGRDGREVFDEIDKKFGFGKYKKKGPALSNKSARKKRA
jgi:prevent-host-death family protein